MDRAASSQSIDLSLEDLIIPNLSFIDAEATIKHLQYKVKLNWCRVFCKVLNSPIQWDNFEFVKVPGIEGQNFSEKEQIFDQMLLKKQDDSNEKRLVLFSRFKVQSELMDFHKLKELLLTQGVLSKSDNLSVLNVFLELESNTPLTNPPLSFTNIFLESFIHRVQSNANPLDWLDCLSDDLKSSYVFLLLFVKGILKIDLENILIDSYSEIMNQEDKKAPDVVDIIKQLQNSAKQIIIKHS